MIYCWVDVDGNPHARTLTSSPSISLACDWVVKSILEFCVSQEFYCYLLDQNGKEHKFFKV